MAQCKGIMGFVRNRPKDMTVINLDTELVKCDMWQSMSNKAVKSLEKEKIDIGGLTIGKTDDGKWDKIGTSEKSSITRLI